MKTATAALWAALAWILLQPGVALGMGPGDAYRSGGGCAGFALPAPPAIRAIIESHPLHFLYGLIAADISFAKKYVPEGRHCHHWHVGEEILATADSPRLRAVGYGYLAHLAADTVAHNLVMQNDHSAADALFDQVLSNTIFGFRTNQRIFRGMIQFSDSDRWRRVFDQVLQRSQFDLPPPVVSVYHALSFESVIDYLVAGADSQPPNLDPIGEVNLKLAKKVQRLSLAQDGVADEAHLHESADEFFPLPEKDLVFWPRREEPESLIRPSDLEATPIVP